MVVKRGASRTGTDESSAQESIDCAKRGDQLRCSTEIEAKVIHSEDPVTAAREWTNVAYYVAEECWWCRDFVWCRYHSEFDLLHYHQTPEYVQGNPYVRTGYRPELPMALCIKSLFKWSNETINIWSHLAGLIYFISCFVYDNVYTLPHMRAHWDDHFVVSISLVCFQICMILSALFHLFFCMSERAHRVWLTMDMLGVSVGMLGIYFSGIYYSFYCHPVWHDLYLAIFFMLAMLTLAAPLHPRYTTQQFTAKRMALYATVAVYGVVPTVHWVLLHGNISSDLSMRFLPNVVIVYLVGCLAFIIYLCMIPERFLPGKLDYIGSSHQWWHILVLFALVWWRWAGLDLLQYRLSTPCAISAEIN